MSLYTSGKTIALNNAAATPLLNSAGASSAGRWDVLVRTPDSTVAVGGSGMTVGSVTDGFLLLPDVDYRFEVLFQDGMDAGLYQLFATTTSGGGATVTVLLVPKF